MKKVILITATALIIIPSLILMNMDNHNIDFSNVDDNPEALHLLAHQDRINHNTSIQALKEKTFELMDIQPHHTILDVGCGLGNGR